MEVRAPQALRTQANGSNVREFLLSSLGQASGICPSIAASLEDARPAGYSLDAAGAHEFLTDEAIALEQAGYGLMLPGLVDAQGHKGPAGRPGQSQQSEDAGRRRPLPGDHRAVRLEMALGDQKLTLRELEALAQMKAPLVGSRSMGRIERPGDSGSDRFLEEEGTGEAAVREILQMSIGARTDR